jgi:hypothetical protein
MHSGTGVVTSEMLRITAQAQGWNPLCQLASNVDQHHMSLSPLFLHVQDV